MLLRRIATLLLATFAPAGAQSLFEAQFISGIGSATRGLVSTLGSPTRPVVFSANIPMANGASIATTPLDTLLDYVDGLKQAGAQRIEFNPGLTSLSDPIVMAKYDALVQHIRQLGL